MPKALKHAPSEVREAYANDPELHRKMSSAGGKKAAENRDNDRLYQAWEGNVSMTEAERRKQSGEHLLPPDSIN